MKKYNTKQLPVFLLLVMLFCINSAKGQITIGADTPPADYSLLQLENVVRPEAGMRLPQISASDKTTTLQPLVDADKAAAKGLTIYNTTSNEVEYWNGTTWIPIPVTIPVLAPTENGILRSVSTDASNKTETNTKRLGGNLSEPTTITLKENLTFTQTSTEKFGIISSANKLFTVTGNKVGMGTDAPTAKLHIERPASGKGFRLKDGSQGEGKVLITDASGNASWQPLLEYTTLDQRNVLTSATLTNETEIAISGTAGVKHITCDKGGWLIIAKCSTQKTGSGTTAYSWIRLKDGNGKILAVAGATPETNPNNNFATPVIVYFTEFEVPTNVHLYAQGQSGTTMKSEFDGFFKAIKIKLSK